uniref:B30.2/SPRY domain-containing protein n=1 Tax=Poecilia reticulata TaxID=8081 RepID=A0A3P9Q429_POERE
INISEPEPEPMTRDELLRYSCEITVDPDTVHTWLVLSEGNRKVTNTYSTERYPSHPDRFTGCEQVLSKESLTGRCYWEVEWTDTETTVAVAYKNIRRLGRGDQCIFGHNDRSWNIRRVGSGDPCIFGNNDRSWALKYNQHCYSYRKKYQLWHNNESISIPGPSSSRVGVFLDHRAGILSFYSISESMTFLYRLQTTFTKPLHAGVLLHGYNDTAEFCQLE